MKLLTLLLAAVLITGCVSPIDEENKLDTPKVETESYFIPKSISSTINFESAYGGLPSEFQFDTTFSDTNSLVGLTTDSFFVYTYFDNEVTRTGSSIEAPELPIAFDTASLNVELATSGVTLKSITITPESSTLTPTAEGITYAATQKITALFSLAALPDVTITQNGTVVVTTEAESYTGPFYPEQWSVQ